MCAPLIRKENETKLKISRGTNLSFIPILVGPPTARKAHGLVKKSGQYWDMIV